MNKYAVIDKKNSVGDYLFNTRIEYLPVLNNKLLDSSQLKEVGLKIMGEEYKDEMSSRKKAFNIVVQNRMRLDKSSFQNRVFNHFRVTHYVEVDRYRRELKAIQKRYGLAENQIIEIKNKFKALILLSNNRTRNDYQDSSINNESII